jgi:hypothetical protein
MARNWIWASAISFPRVVAWISSATSPDFLGVRQGCDGGLVRGVVLVGRRQFVRQLQQGPGEKACVLGGLHGLSGRHQRGALDRQRVHVETGCRGFDRLEDGEQVALLDGDVLRFPEENPERGGVVAAAGRVVQKRAHERQTVRRRLLGVLLLEEVPDDFLRIALLRRVRDGGPDGGRPRTIRGRVPADTVQLAELLDRPQTVGRELLLFRSSHLLQDETADPCSLEHEGGVDEQGLRTPQARGFNRALRLLEQLVGALLDLLQVRTLLNQEADQENSQDRHALKYCTGLPGDTRIVA